MPDVAELMTVNALAAALKRDRRTIGAAVQGLSPVVDGALSKYRLSDVAAKLKERADASLKDQKLAEEIRKLKLRNDREEGRLVWRATVCEEMRRILLPIPTLLETKLVQEYPMAVAGMDVPNARVYGRRMVDELLKHFRELGDHFSS